MKNWKHLMLAATAVLALAACGESGGDDEYEGDKLKISMRNLYFGSWAGGDVYLQEIEEKFKVSITASSYSYNDWNSQVAGAVNGNNLTDVFQFNVTQFNYANSYKYWAEGNITKALPDDLSQWPNVQKVINSLTSIESLKIDGHLYGIPIMKNINKAKVDYSPFTYLYRRDWAKQWGVYQENDEYTYDQFMDVIKAFNKNLNADGQGTQYAMADVEWGFPSITNFYKDSPHCFTFDETQQKYVSTFATEDYQEGLDLAKTYVDTKIYGYDQYSALEGGARKAYTQGKCGIFYENLSYSNYQVIRDAFETANTANPDFVLDDATAIMKVKGPDGKYALEGTDNWFSMTLFNYDISDAKMKKILDLYDYLLSEEGTMLAVYGLEGYDYKKDGDGKIVLTENGWPKGDDGEYVEKTNGAKFLRYCITLGNDYLSYDPLTDQDSFQVLNDWSNDMDAANSAGNLRVFKEKEEVMWLSTPLKDQYESNLLSSANDQVIRYCYGKIDKPAYLSAVSEGQWPSVLDEINETLGYSK